MNVNWEQLLTELGTLLFRFIGALIVLLIGWLIAKWIGKLVTKILHRFNVDERTSKWAGDGEDIPKVEEGIGTIVYYLLMLFVLVLFFEVLGLTLITAPLNALLATILSYLPSLVVAGALVVAAWIVAAILRGFTRRLLQGTGVDKRVGDQAGSDSVPISKGVSEAVYWLVWLIFLPPILGALGMESLVAPLTVMLVDLLDYIPNLLAAGVILLVGWFVAKIIRRIATGFLAAIGTDKFSDRIGLGKVLGSQNLSGLLGLIVFILILIPVIIAALEALNMDALTTPLSAMLETIFTAIPAIIAAFVILAVAYVIGKLLGELVANILEGLGFDNILVFLGLAKEPTAGKAAPSQIVGVIVLIAVMLTAALSAASLLNMPAISLLVAQFIAFAWRILIGLIIFGIGLWVADLLAKAIKSTDWPQRNVASLFARGAVVVLATAMALGQMGLASSIIDLAFGLTVGGIALAAALAFGLGGREVAGRELESWVKTVHELEPAPVDVDEAATDTEA